MSLIRLRRCTDLFESSVSLSRYVFSRCGSNRYRQWRNKSVEKASLNLRYIGSSVCHCLKIYKQKLN